MELRQSWYEPEAEREFPFVEEELYYQTKDRLDEAEILFFQLTEELYDDCKNVDRDIVHGIMKKLGDVLDCNIPSIDDLKL